MTESPLEFPAYLLGRPPRLVFAAGALGQLGALAREAGLTRALIVTDPGVAAAGHAGRAVDALRSTGIKAVHYDGAAENPTETHVSRAADAARRFGADGLIGLGGGSAMDCAKGALFILAGGGRMRDYCGVGRIARPMPPLIAVPTTAGTGSEAQSFALITHDDTYEKMACGDPQALPRAAILDPDLIATAPHVVAAAAGIDAVSHAVETAGTTRRTDESRDLSRRAWALLDSAFERALAGATPSGRSCSTRENLEQGPRFSGTVGPASLPARRARRPAPLKHDAQRPAPLEDTVGPASLPARRAQRPAPLDSEDRGDADARARMLLGAHLAGAAIERSMLGAAHACANPLTARFGIVHGVAVGLMLPHVVRFNAAGGDNPYSDLAESADELSLRIEAMLDAAALPRRLSQLGLGADDLPELAHIAAVQWTAGFNPRRVDAAALQEIYQAAM